MWLTGIYDMAQLGKFEKSLEALGPHRRISVTLYDQISKSPDADALAERILLLFTDSRGAYKRTYVKRFEVFDGQVLKLMADLFSKDQPFIFQDLAISDGRTALDFFERISESFQKLSYHASDFNPRVDVLQKGSLKVTIAKDQKVIEIMIPPFVLNRMRQEKMYLFPINRLLSFMAYHLFAKPLVRDFQRGEVTSQELLLFAPKVLQKAEEDSRFQLSQQDLLEPLPIQSHAIRAMNVLNRSYFTAQEFKRIIQNIHNGLLHGGIFITGSNQDAGSTVHGGVYQKTPSGFVKVMQSGDGSPVEEFILG